MTAIYWFLKWLATFLIQDIQVSVDRAHSKLVLKKLRPFKVPLQIPLGGSVDPGQSDLMVLWMKSRNSASFASLVKFQKQGVVLLKPWI